ncbi:MAG: hypothetical protein Q4D16_25580 [Eubacteriales bacterium]|nr:hypothetical protein [Eubacteriales bacterium]
MKKKLIISLITAACLALSAPWGVMAAAGTEDTSETDAGTSSQAEADSEASADSDSAAGLSDDIYAFQMEIEGVLYQLPMSYADFTDLGWTLDKGEDPEMKVTANSYGSLYFDKGELNVRAEVINLGVNEVPASECLIAGIAIDEGFSDIDLPALNITLPKGIVMGKSNVDDIKAAYGEPTDTYESDMYTKMSYEKDFYQQVELYVYTEENTLRQVSIRNFAEPEGYDKGSVSKETPEIVSAYTAPTELGTDMLDPVVEVRREVA